VNERGVDYGVSRGSTTAQAFEIREVAAMHLRARRSNRPRRSFGSREAEHLVSRRNQFSDNRRADKAARAGNENTHRIFSRVGSIRFSAYDLSG
jgi:hypothetical protein